MSDFDSKDFLILYPGIYSDREKNFVEQYFADARAIEARGPIDAKALVEGTLPKDTPGLGPRIPVTETMIRYNNEKYDPENRILNDADYARQLGYENIMAMPGFGAHDDSFLIPFPPDARDTLLVCSLSHNITNHHPIYPGDVLFLVMDPRHVVDWTPPEGSVYRSLAIECQGSVYNQEAKKVTSMIFRVTENIKIYKDEKNRPSNPTFEDIWEAPDWLRRPKRYYTDADWKYIKKLWSDEKRQGADPLYWEDVNIGDLPTWTVDGPVEESVSPIAPWGMGLGGSRTLKREIMDAGIFPTLVRDKKDGIYRTRKREEHVPPSPEDHATVKPDTPTGETDTAVDTKDIHRVRETRSYLINYMGREYALRHINAWMGDHGWVLNIRWGIMSPAVMALHGKKVPVNSSEVRHLNTIPHMKGKNLTTHGLTMDLAIVKSYVYDKYVLDDQFLVELGWWIETIDGHIWEEGGATVRLPSKKGTM